MNIYNKNNIFQQCIYEFLGTGIIIFFTIGCLAASKLTEIYFNKYEMSIILGFAVSFSTYLTRSISGAHLNPAITIFFWLHCKFNKKKVIPYILSQISGSFFFTMIIYFIYRDIIILFENKHNIVRGTKNSIELASIFCNYFQKNDVFIHEFIIQIITSVIFIIILMKINENKKNSILYKFVPCLTGVLVTNINICLSFLNNFTLNPAHDLGPRIFLSLIGWGKTSFTGLSNSYFSYFFISIIAPISGINIGGWIYKHSINT